MIKMFLALGTGAVRTAIHVHGTHTLISYKTNFGEESDFSGKHAVYVPSSGLAKTETKQKQQNKN